MTTRGVLGGHMKTFDTRGRGSKIRVRGTEELLSNLSVLNFKDLRNNSSDVVREKSRELLQRLCDKDKTYYEDEMASIKKKMQEHIQNSTTKQSVKE